MFLKQFLILVILLCVSLNQTRNLSLSLSLKRDVSCSPEAPPFPGQSVPPGVPERASSWATSGSSGRRPICRAPWLTASAVLLWAPGERTNHSRFKHSLVALNQPSCKVPTKKKKKKQMFSQFIFTMGNITCHFLRSLVTLKMGQHLSLNPVWMWRVR